MEASDYLIDPCRASSLPFWKTERLTLPENITILRDDEFAGYQYSGSDESYFKLAHDLKSLRKPVLPKGFEIVQCGIDEFVRQINSCYTQEHLSAEELLAYRSHPVYRPDLWIAVADALSGMTAATGIAELDTRIGEGVLEWIQVSPDYRRRGLGSFIVCELLTRMQDQARFVTVSGRLKSRSNPFALYRSCGFAHPVIWHIVTV